MYFTDTTIKFIKVSLSLTTVVTETNELSSNTVIHDMYAYFRVFLSLAWELVICSSSKRENCVLKGHDEQTSIHQECKDPYEHEYRPKNAGGIDIIDQ